MPIDALARPAPITAAAYRQRRHDLMRQLPADAAVLVMGASLATRSHDSEYPFRQDSDFYYLTGIQEPDGLLLLLPGVSPDDDHAIVFCQPRDPLREAWTGRRLGPQGMLDQHGLDDAHENGERNARLADYLKGRGTLYLTFRHEPVMALAHQLRQTLSGQSRDLAGITVFQDLAPLLHEMRLVKSDAELDLLRHAARLSALAHCRAMQRVVPGMMEYQLQAELEHSFMWQGASGPAYTTIVGGGDNACVLHYIENRDILADGDLVLVDAGAEFDLYAGDITRTFPVSGTFSPNQRALYEVVLEAQQNAVAAIRPGVTLADIHAGVVYDLIKGLISLGLLDGSAEARVEDNSVQRFYLHSTSHWLGLDVHDVGGYRLDQAPRTLVPGMVLTVEPGLYMPADDDIPAAFRGIGIRIEDDVIVTADGCEVITSQVPKQVAEIEALMASS